MSGTHVGIVAPEFPPALGGIEIYGWELARELVRRGYRVSVFTRAHPEGEATLEGAEIHPTLQACRRRDRCILEHAGVDLWHATNAAYAWLALETAAPVLVSVHGDDFKHPYIPVARADISLHWRLPGLSARLQTLDRKLGRALTVPLLARSFRKVRHVIANSRYTEGFFLRRYPQCAGKTSVAWVGVSEEFFDTPPAERSSAEAPRLVTVARLSQPHKNIDTVLRALAALKDDFAFTYSIVGDGHLRPGLERLAGELGLTERVRFLGRLPGETMRAELAASDLFVLTSTENKTSYEGFGIVYLEANACGTPVLASRVAGAPEAVSEGVSGMLAEDGSLAQVTARLRAFLAGEEAFDRTDCRAFAEGFHWPVIVDRIEDRYREALCAA
jgi:glycosyltransferase involved in cell wall biosynthesis